MTYTDSPYHVGYLQHAVDYIVPVGTLVMAAADGVVVDLKDDSFIGGPDLSFDILGNFIEIRHADNEYSIYEHLQAFSSRVNVGDKVLRGIVIGASGATGALAHLGPHLHFNVHRYTAKKDYESVPIVWL